MCLALEILRPSSYRAAAIHTLVGGLIAASVLVGLANGAEWRAVLLTDHSEPASPTGWKVDYLGGRSPREYANGNNWEFRATHPESGETKIFRSGTKMGYFIAARTYQSTVLIGADLGSGVWGFTIYDLDAERKVHEFWAHFPHLSPDDRHLVYRKFYRRNERMDPTVLVVDLGRELGEVGMADPSEGIGVAVFPPTVPDSRPEHAAAYGTTVTGFLFDHVAWDMEHKVLYFTASDRSGHLNLVVVPLEPSPRAACYVPLTAKRLHGEYFDEKKVVPKNISLPSPGTVKVITSNGFGVSSEHNVDLREACWRQDQAYAERVSM